MKPKRNIFFCSGAGKYKMLFESQSKADNFIRFNSQEILEEKGKTPIRSYYCEICGGYHVTSNSSKIVGKKLDQRDHLHVERFSAYKREHKEVKSLCDSLSQRLVKVRELLFFGIIHEAEELLDICDFDIDELSNRQFCRGEKLTMLKGRVDAMYKLLSSIKKLIVLPEQEKERLLSSPNLQKDLYTLKIIYSNIQAIQQIDLLLKENDFFLCNNKIDGVVERICKCKELLESIQRFGKREMKSKYNALIHEQELLFEKVRSGGCC
ncbi:MULTISPECIES: hypothetical protein [unclassified Bacteroides]|uniref:hypothetical protein n=1 Tax=unclassified Bacteroides TaxID=2646097 RepID=UPI0004E1FBB0|nr:MULTISPECIES: hypothetical protein [unclassified Bacteroides]